MVLCATVKLIPSLFPKKVLVSEEVLAAKFRI